MKSKPGRNDPCPCGSGKKFKKCCDKKMLGGKFMASRIGGLSSGSTTSKLSSFFQNNVSNLKPLGESGRTFTVQKGALPKKPQPDPSLSHTQDKEQPPVESTSNEDSSSTAEVSEEVVKPEGEEETPPPENDEAHS